MRGERLGFKVRKREHAGVFVDPTSLGGVYIQPLWSHLHPIPNSHWDFLLHPLDFTRCSHQAHLRWHVCTVSFLLLSSSYHCASRSVLLLCPMMRKRVVSLVYRLLMFAAAYLFSQNASACSHHFNSRVSCPRRQFTHSC